MKQRLTTGNGNNRSTALFYCINAFLNGKTLIKDFRRLVNFTAALTAQVALKERFEHQHQRVMLVALQGLSENVFTESSYLNCRNCQGLNLISAAWGRVVFIQLPFCLRRL